MFNFLNKNKVALIYYPLFLYWVILFLLTTLPGKDVPNIGVSDKIEHTTAYMVLSILLCFTFHFQRKIKLFFRRPFLLTILVVAFYGMLDELHQLFIPGRSCDIHDWMADITGAGLGLLFVFLIKLLSRSTSNSLES